MRRVLVLVFSLLLAASTAASAAQLIYDSFTDTSNIPLVNHAGEVNSGWKQGWNSNSYIDTANKATYSTTDGNIWNTGTLSTGDYSVIGTIHCFGWTSGTNAGVSGRIQTSGSYTNGRYFADFAHGVGWRLMKEVSGTETQLGSTYLDPAGGTDLVAGSTHTVELRMIGTAISMYVDNVLAASATDANFSTGAAGLEVAASPSAGSMYEFTSFTVSTPTTSTTPATLVTRAVFSPDGLATHTWSTATATPTGCPAGSVVLQKAQSPGTEIDLLYAPSTDATCAKNLGAYLDLVLAKSPANGTVTLP
ncbi:hypothetical protein L4X63_00225 [Geomonas sp. Red32]|uniref:hypothetical protein n=1 Tax=Geomonas sp. Red32 TaxID=2912856 RepID=UPI00202CBA15|nr:hypothetical protein [Geomonas sp. Red32]MCM0080007.1 hypothetical protein [Geomonas sp. Red32]